MDADRLLDEIDAGRRRPRSNPPPPAPAARSDVLPRRPRRPPADGRTVEGGTGPAAVTPAVAAAARSAVAGERPTGRGDGTALPAGAPSPVPAGPPHPGAQRSSGLPASGTFAAMGGPGTGAISPAGHARSGAERGSTTTVGPVVPTRRQRQAARRLQARKVGRLVRHVDLWSVFKLALLFHLSAFLITLLAGTLLWAVGVSTGVVGDLEGFVREAFALEQFSFDGRAIFEAAALGGLALVGAATVVTVLFAALLNLISDVVGGVRFTVVEEETARPRPAPRRPVDR